MTASLPPAEPSTILAAEGSLPLADFVERARRRLFHAAPVTGEAARGDHDLTPQFRGMVDPSRMRDAAVLVPVMARPEPTVLLTLRSAHLSSHAGQIAFPGGKIEPFDEGPAGAALREAQEEVGLDPARVTPLGYLDAYLTRTAFRIVPVVALVDAAAELTINRDEVDEAFEVPLGFLMAPGNHQRHSRQSDGLTRMFHAMAYEDRFIWGVTAGILRNLYERIYG
ncbi:CoA pyrophosphatase [Ancylobacter sp. 6x-1]|uniref:CoA pyrophosphatase n=1 Tax=Ancylobacter crimeensis TaxID=2579147 RepID=A0ABT0D9N9_9HYPH|nr:CoA pyrophosphatase [Ancylobacter crimeensis]MCK0196658.1 CoA pyrophosphatase [Ancylobacter crimeensis]